MNIKKHIFNVIILFFGINNIFAQVDVLCAGNSITWGTGLVDRSNDCYPSQLEVLLGDNYIVANRGEPGRTLLRDTELPYMESNQYYFSLAHPHDIVLILLGTNDSDEDNWDVKEDFKNDYYALIDAYKNNNIKWGQEEPVFILGLPPPVFDESNGHRNAPIINEIIPMIKQIANEFDYAVADFYTALNGKPEMYIDGVHPNTQGAQIMADVANAAIQKALTTSGLAPDTPTGLETIPQLYSIKLRWHANLEEDIFQYRVFRSDSQYGFQNIIGNTFPPDTTFTDGNVILDHIYYYAIDAIDLQGNISGRSSIVYGKTFDQISPVAPKNLTVTLNADSIQLDWSPNGENDLEKYYVYRNSDQTMLQEASSIIATVYKPLSAYNDIAFESGVHYYYGVKAMDVSGNQSSISNIVEITAHSRPITQDTVLTTLEDITYSFKGKDFPFSDVDNDTLDKIIFIETKNWDFFTYDSNEIENKTICEDISKLTFTSQPNEFGDDYTSFKYQVVDSFGSTSIDTNIVTINVSPVNDKPSLDPIDDIYIIEDSHDIVLPLNGINPGPPNEIQNLSIEIIRDTSLIKISDIKYINPDTSGYVIIDPIENVFGSRPITIRISDDGGTENGGINYTYQSFYLYITPTNDPPAFNSMDKIILSEDVNTTIEIIGINAGPWEVNQNISISVISNNTDILPTPTLSYNIPDTSATLFFNTLPNVFGNTSITLIMKDDGGTAFGGKDSTSYIIPVEIQPVNDKPNDFSIITPTSDSTFVINKQNLNTTCLIGWESSSDIENDLITYDIIFSDELSELSRYGLEMTEIVYTMKELLAATDTVTITQDNFSVLASDGVDKTPALNSNISFTINGQIFAPSKLNLDQNYPNPFNNNTLIGFDLPKRSYVNLVIYDILGKEIVILIDNELYERGYSTITWSGYDNNQNHVPAGIYFMQISVGNKMQYKKLLLLK